ncbi:hypothetical protein LEMLEM_LOCUS16078 [Lemmus lemmus]
MNKVHTFDLMYSGLVITRCVTEDDFEVLILLLPTPKCWDYSNKNLTQHIAQGTKGRRGRWSEGVLASNFVFPEFSVLALSASCLWMKM